MFGSPVGRRGALFAAEPARPQPGRLIYVRQGDKNDGDPPVAQVISDTTGFDVALPIGTFCFVISPDDPKQPCDYVARIDERTPAIENVALAPPGPQFEPCPPGVP